MTNSTGTIPDNAELADRLAISETLARHSRGIDRLDSACIADCYWPDAEVDYGAFKGPAATFAELVVPALESQYEMTRHSLSNTLFQIDAATARVETCVSACHLVQGAAAELHVYGRYLDRMEKREGAWKILHRQVVMDWGRRIAVVDERESDAFAQLTRGGHGDADPLHPFLRAG